MENSLDEEKVRAAVTYLVEEVGIESLAVRLLHSYANSSHELAIRRLAAAQYPGFFIATSADFFPDLPLRVCTLDKNLH